MPFPPRRRKDGSIVVRGPDVHVPGAQPLRTLSETINPATGRTVAVEFEVPKKVLHPKAGTTETIVFDRPAHGGKKPKRKPR